MKNYIIYLLSILAMSLLLACDRGGEFELDNNTLALTLSCSDITRADADVDALNENKIVSLDCYFYAASLNATTADFNAPARVHRRISSINAKEQYITYISFTEEEIKDIFVDVTGRTNSTCFIYVIANCSSDILSSFPTSLPTINQLKSLTIESNFQNYNTPQSSFVMDSEGNDVVTLTVNSNGSKTLEGDVVLRRAAAKISFSIRGFGSDDTKNEVEINGKKYTPNYGGIYVIFDNCVYKSHIAPDVVSNDNIDNRYCDVGSDKDDATKIKMQTTDGHAPCTLSMPFYSYPSDWSATEENDAYISLVVPWKAVDEDIFKPYHYKVPINPDKDKLERNIHYKISVQISMLGTLDPDQAVEIAPSYVIFDCLNWNNDEINAIITDFRYLMVEDTSYVLNNVDMIEIPYWTSHPCKIVDAKITQADIKTGGDKTISNPMSYITLEDDKIIYSKVLDNNYRSETFDFAPYTITFTIQHTTESTKYQEKITITQYPAIYGQAEENWDYSNNYNGKTGTDGNNGFTYVNGYQADDNGNYDFFGTVNGLSGNSSSSPNRYIFTVTSVEGTPYVIGDPRDVEVTYDGDEAVWYDKGRRITNGVINTTENNEIRYYYGTDVTSTRYDNATSTNAIYANDAEAEAAERTINMIAPKFMVASGYAVLGYSHEKMKTLENLKKRCASYQEDGYPAGRWRLPTRAEFQFMVSQVNKEPNPPLPQIYIAGSEYWCAHGVGKPDTEGNVTMRYVGRDGSGHSTRCVYDIWYWGEHDKLKTAAEKDEFTWGDVLRSEKAYAPAIKY